MNGQGQYNKKIDTLIDSNKFINLLMVDGKKSRAVQLFYDSLYIIKHKKLKKNLLISKSNQMKLIQIDPVDLNHNQRIGKGIINGVDSDLDFEKKTSSNLISSGNLDKINEIYKINKICKINEIYKSRVSIQTSGEITIPLNNNFTSNENKEMSSLLELVSIAIENVTPSVELKKVRRAGNTFLIPAILSQHKASTLAMRWIIESARKKQQGSSQNFSECLADEIYQAYLKQGKARQKRDELHTAAVSNRANIRYRWW
jgi:ribosomal protein S7